MYKKIRMFGLTLLLASSLSSTALAGTADSSSSGSTTSQRQESDNSMDWSWLGILGLAGLLGLRGGEKKHNYGDTTPSSGNNSMRDKEIARDRARI